jgi:NAD(P)-dependent dehydrogenase (short-subunit alcohol dehydrogenase family)
VSWALVTGSSKGIGAAVATGLAADGYDTIVHFGGDRDGAEQVARRCRDHDVQTRVVGADLRTDCAPLLDAVDEVGGVAVLVNNASVTADGLTMTMSRAAPHPDEGGPPVAEIQVERSEDICGNVEIAHAAPVGDLAKPEGARSVETVDAIGGGLGAHVQVDVGGCDRRRGGWIERAIPDHRRETRALRR